MDDLYNELMHFGVLGMHWGQRKSEKRYKTIMEAANKAKTLAKEDHNNANEITKKLSKKMSDKQVQYIVKDQYGPNYKDKQYILNDLKSQGYKSERDWVESYNNGEKFAEKQFKQSAKQFKKISEKFNNIKITDLSSQNYKEAKEFIKKAYSGAVDPNYLNKMSKYLENP